jgi:hypothetical protein
VLPGLVRALLAAGPNALGRRENTLSAIESLPGVARTDRDFGPITPALASQPMLCLEDPLILPLVEAPGEGLRLPIRVGGHGERFRHHWRPQGLAFVRPVEEAMAAIDRIFKETGLDRVELVGDAPRRHPNLHFLVESINRRFPGVRVGLDDFGLTEPRPALAREILRGKRAPIVMSPWAATATLRASLGVVGTDDAFIEAAATALRGGAIPMTFRFGFGWPGESGPDRVAIGELMKRIRTEAMGTVSTRLVVELHPFVPQPGSDGWRRTGLPSGSPR